MPTTVVTNQAIAQPDKAAGVVAKPATAIAANIHKYVADALKREPHTTNGVALKVDLASGMSVVIAHRTPGGWEIDGYFGSRWDGSVYVGGEIMKRW